MKAETARWLTFAAEDLAAAEHAAERFPRTAVWSCQQAAEKAPKSSLPEYDIHFPKTHDLVLLLGIAPAELALPGSLRSEAASLNAYGPGCRYPDFATQLGRPEAQLAIKAATAIVHAVTSTLSQARP